MLPSFFVLGLVDDRERVEIQMRKKKVSHSSFPIVFFSTREEKKVL